MKKTGIIVMAVAILASCVSLVDLGEDLEAGGPHDAWMELLDNDTVLADVTIPGAHDAASSTIAVWPQWTRTQDLNIAQLWNAGVRAFDLRPAFVNGIMGVYHDKYSARVTFAEIYATLVKAVDIHPTEFAILLLRHEVEADDGSPAWENEMRDILSAHDDYLVDYHEGITVGELRGKLLVLSRDSYEDGPFGGYISGWYSGTELSKQQSVVIENAAGTFFPLWVQDYYKPTGADDKWEEVREMMDATANASPRPLVVNHVSGYVGKLPDYRKNASDINARAAVHLRQNHAPAGIVMMDFAGTDTSRGIAVKGKELVHVLIENNR